MFNEMRKMYGEDFNRFEPLNTTAFEIELEKELTSLHPLFGLALKAVGKNDRNHDVLFIDGAIFYIVHRTWSTTSKDYPCYQKILADKIHNVLEQDYQYGK